MPDNGSDCVGSLNSFFDLFFIVLIWVHIHWLIFQTECRLQTYKYPAAEAAPAAARWMVFVVISVLVHYCFLLTEAHTNTQFLLLLGSNVSYPFFPLSSQSLFLIFFFPLASAPVPVWLANTQKLDNMHTHTRTKRWLNFVAIFHSHSDSHCRRLFIAINTIRKQRVHEVTQLRLGPLSDLKM